MSVEATATKVAEAPLVVAKGFGAVIKAHPIASAFVLAAAAIVVLRYGRTILRTLGMVPVVGGRAVSFAGAGR